ncbi:nicotinamide mononucleotide transporter [Aerococcus sp. 150760007-1]|uniref:Nicotinamide mononucleotide transporter n=1 Tax=Aerococcus urinaeequi TaxID=51665 RepID=A0ABR5ZXV1_9LACT|nr:nicotinamide riboside transporter PnuC [Aerococcus urinaeequi]MBA5746565.1 nicotinamide mononucleotide transporter [Aerococcus urinaeequi]MBA5829384.1 nicotinamide mononucleotide transporter [Aerococcus urinaeequi]MBA5860253.1 nicotinamide mononucleotide transporter [Aerococcus urinaeequi]
MTNKKKIIIGLQIVATVYLLGNMIYSNLQAFDLMSTAMGLLGLFGNILLAHKKSSTFALNMSNNVLGGVLSFQNRFFAEVGMNIIYFVTQALQGIPYFRNHKDETGEVETKSEFEPIKIITYIAFGTVAMGLISKYFDGNMVVLDSVQNGIAIGAQLRQMNGNADGWLLWVLSNIINIIVWVSVGNWILVASFAAYAIVAVSGYLNWSE